MIRAILALLMLPLALRAQEIVTIVQPAAIVAPAHDYFYERFSVTGYDTTILSETSTPNEDYDITSLTANAQGWFSTQGCYYDVNATAIVSTWDKGSAIDLSSTGCLWTLWVWFDSAGLVETQNFNIFRFGSVNAPGSGVGDSIEMRVVAGPAVEVRGTGAVASPYVAVPSNQWVKISLYQHPTHASSYIAINDGTHYTFTRRSETTLRYVHAGATNNVGAGDTNDVVFAAIVANRQ